MCMSINEFRAVGFPDAGGVRLGDCTIRQTKETSRLKYFTDLVKTLPVVLEFFKDPRYSVLRRKPAGQQAININDNSGKDIPVCRSAKC